MEKLFHFTDKKENINKLLTGGQGSPNHQSHIFPKLIHCVLSAKPVCPDDATVFPFIPCKFCLLLLNIIIPEGSSSPGHPATP